MVMGVTPTPAAPSGPQAGPLRVFVSYSRNDIDFADQLTAALALTGFTVSLDRHKITGGEDFRHRLGTLIREADTVVFVLSPASAASEMCAWEVAEAVRLGKRIIPVLCRSLESTSPPVRLANLDYVFFYPDPKVAGSGFGHGLVRLVTALNTDLDWLQEHTRLLVRASEWASAGRPENRLISGNDIAAAKAWAARRPKGAPEPTDMHLDYIRASEEAEKARMSAERQRIEETARFQAEREAALGKAEIAQQEKEEASRRLVRRTYTGMAVAALLTITSLGAGLFAINKQKLAEEQTARAEKNLGAIKDALALLDTASGTGDVAQKFFSLATNYFEQGSYEEAITLYQRCAAMAEKQFGPQSSELAAAFTQLGAVYFKQNKLAEAESFLARALAIDEAASPPRTSSLTAVLSILATVYGAQGQMDKVREAELKLRQLALTADADIQTIYYGTDRAREDTGTSGDGASRSIISKTAGAPGTSAGVSYGAERGHRLELGKALVSVPKSHQAASIERPWSIKVLSLDLYKESEDPSRHFILSETSPLSEDEFVESTRANHPAESAYKDQAIVLVHGPGITFQSAVFRAASLAKALGFDGTFFVYSWPSNGEPASYYYNHGSAHQAEPHLRAFLALVSAKTGASRVNLIAHAMGASLLLRALRHGPGTSEMPIQIAELILAAPDAGRDEFLNLIAGVKDAAKGITLYASANDPALTVARRRSGGAGRAGDVEADGPLIAPGVDTIDATAMDKRVAALSHSAFADGNAMLRDIAALLRTSARPPDARTPDLQKIATPRGVYWRISAAGGN